MFGLPKEYGPKIVTSINICERKKQFGHFLATKRRENFSEFVEFLIMDFGKKFYKENPKYRTAIYGIFKSKIK